MDFHALYLRRKFWLNDWLNGSPIGKHYRDVKYISEHSVKDVNNIRERKLMDLLSFAHNYSTFYKNYPQNEFEAYPVMNKTDLIAQYEAIRVAEMFIPGQKGKVHIQTTSGSTGTPLAIPQDTEKRFRRIAELKYFGKIVGFNSHEMLIHLRTWNKWQSKTPSQIRRENIIPFDISDMGDERMHVLAELIQRHKAVCLRGYASSFDIFSKYVEAHPTSFPSLKIVIAGSEALHDDVRANVKKFLDCEIISQYANEECGILAQERIPTQVNGNVMYLNHASYFFEFLKLNSDTAADFGELGRIVVTDLCNKAFPIIRYDTGDVGILMPPDEFSHGFPVLGKLYGRRLDVCYTTDGHPFHPMAIGRIMKHFNGIKQWQFIQKSEREYTLKVVMKESLPIDYFQSAIDNLLSIVGNNAKILIEEVNEIPVLSSGKRKAVVNEWKK